MIEEGLQRVRRNEDDVQAEPNFRSEEDEEDEQKRFLIYASARLSKGQPKLVRKMVYFLLLF
jgi:hypothetical protein